MLFNERYTVRLDKTVQIRSILNKSNGERAPCRDICGLAETMAQKTKGIPKRTLFAESSSLSSPHAPPALFDLLFPSIPQLRERLPQPTVHNFALNAGDPVSDFPAGRFHLIERGAVKLAGQSISLVHMEIEIRLSTGC